jgi:CBS domain-containing protein
MAHTVPSEDWNQLEKLLNTLDLRSLVEEQETVVVTANESVGGVLATLATHSILSAPVYDPSTNSFLGLVDILDLVAFLCSLSNWLRGGTNKQQLDLGVLQKRFSSLEEEHLSNIKATSVRDVINMAATERTMWAPISVSTPPQTVIKLLADPNLQRLPVTEDDGDRFLGIVTQSDIIKWLDDHKEDIPKALKEVKVRDLTTPLSEDVPKLSCDATMIEAFMKMELHRISALPVVDSQGFLKGNISASDIKKLNISPSDGPENMLGKLLTSVSSCFASPLLACSLDHCLNELFSSIVAERIHQVWIVDSNMVTVGAINLCHILAQFIPPTPERFYSY